MFYSTSIPPTGGSLSQVFAYVLRAQFPAIKHAAVALHVSHRTVENWWTGRRTIGGDELVSAMAANVDLERAILDLVAERRRVAKCSGGQG